MEHSETMCTRRGFFAALLKEAGEAAQSVVSEMAGGLDAVARPLVPAVRPPLKPFVRPPGAVEEARFLDRCSRCDDCVKACPEWVVRKAGSEFGERLAGTPIILPVENPCVFCEGLPCITACKTGALVVPASGAFTRIGLAVVDAARCYMAQGQPCDYCVKDCPERPRAIRLGAPGKPAEVLADACTGCGECAEICPANAITIEATR